MTSEKDYIFQKKSDQINSSGFYCKGKGRKIVLSITVCLVIGTVLFIGIFFGTKHAKANIDNNVIHCEVAILGAGFAGVYAAYQLGNRSGNTICLIEKLDRFGGRVYDVAGWDGGPLFGVGALRVISPQITMLALADELDIEMQKEESDHELLRVRGQYFYRDVGHGHSESNEMCTKAFHNMTCNYPNGTDTDKDMLKRILDIYHNNKSVALEYADFPNYILALFGDEGLAFIRESVRYNSLFTSVSIQGILDFFSFELRGMGLDPDRFYPSGGISQFINKMIRHANHSNVQIYEQEPVLTIDYVTSNENKATYEPFRISTPHYVFRAKSVLCAIDPINLRAVNGDIANSLTSSSEFSVILPKKVVIVTAWWYERWWERSLLFKNLSRVVSHENCFNMMDIPTFPYGRDQNVTRAVYDDGACVGMWETVINTGNKNMLAKTMIASLRNVFFDVNVSEPRAVHGYVHNNAWHFQVANSNISNQRIFDWSQHPIHGKNFSLIGEGYNLNFAAWCDGALKSTMWALSSFYNFTYPCLNDTGSPASCPSAAENGIFSTMHDIRRPLFG